MTKITFNKLAKEEKGQAFILALIMLLVGGLIIAPLMGFMATGLIAGQVFEKKMNGFYAADAGIEDAIWKIMNDPSYSSSYQLTDVNGMSVDVVIEEVTTFYVLDVGEGGGHNSYFELTSELISYTANGGSSLYEYELTMTNKTNSPVRVERVIVGYSSELDYSLGLTDEDTAGLKSGSFESFTTEFIELENITLLTWDLTPPRPELEAAPDPGNEVYTTVICRFVLEGPEDVTGVTILLVTSRQDIGAVWDFKPFKITATALADDGSTVVVETGLLEGSDTVLVRSWEIDPPEPE